MPRRPNDELAAADASFLKSQQKKGVAKMGRPTKDEVIMRALRDNTTAFFKRVLDDETEEKLWKRFLEGRAPVLDAQGNQVKDKDGFPVFFDLNGVAWNAFKQMVAYKRGMPTIRVEENQGQSHITVNFNVMGASQKDMHNKVRELGLLPVSTT